MTLSEVVMALTEDVLRDIVFGAVAREQGPDAVRTEAYRVMLLRLFGEYAAGSGIPGHWQAVQEAVRFRMLLRTILDGVGENEPGTRASLKTEYAQAWIALYESWLTLMEYLHEHLQELPASHWQAETPAHLARQITAAREDQSRYVQAFGRAGTFSISRQDVGLAKRFCNVIPEVLLGSTAYEQFIQEFQVAYALMDQLLVMVVPGSSRPS